MFTVSSVFLVLVAANGVFCSRVLEVRGVQTVLAVENEHVVISCEDDLSMSYCGFTHPNGTRYSFAGSNINSQCLISIKVARNDSGRWTCHIGKKDAPGEEITQIKNIRVADKLAAVEPNITTNHGTEVTLTCTTAQKMQPLSYCRFVPPKGRPFSINGDVTKNKSILGRYYFPANKSLDRGDCAVTIAKVKYDDLGLWVCGAWLEEDSKEFVDNINLRVEGLYTISTASVTGIVFGVVTVVILLSLTAFIAWKKRSGIVGPAAATEVIEIEELERLRRNLTPQPSGVPEINILSPSEGSDASPQEKRPLNSEI